MEHVTLTKNLVLRLVHVAIDVKAHFSLHGVVVSAFSGKQHLCNVWSLFVDFVDALFFYFEVSLSFYAIFAVFRIKLDLGTFVVSLIEFSNRNVVIFLVAFISAHISTSP